MTNYEDAVKQLVKAIRSHDSVKEFQIIEQKVKQLSELEYLAHDMKAYQQEEVLLKKIEKTRAAQAAGNQAEQIKDQLSQMPIVQDYRDKMQDASDLLQYITKTLEDKINKELRDGK
ncbi:YlbF family regulator [Streptococcus caballi]|uniref:YlbF family regulator n=1 Tax=Streptococcus caballi TaxID=439220 RepID=UPI000382064E|nr:YlbF family regulator [Streptococcus caballi]